MVLRRRLVSSVSVCAALLPAVLWLWPALTSGRAPSFRDQGDFFYPLKLYTADRMRAGEIPLWNPLSGTGEPWLANGQSGVFYPPNLLFLLPSPALAAGLYVLLHFAIAVWGARRFLKEENVSEAGSLFGAAAFAACGYAASLSAYWNHFGAFAYLPAIAAVARTGLRSRASMLGLAVLVGLQAMAGSPEMSLASIALAIALALAPRREFPDPIVALPRAVSVRRLGAGIALGLAARGVGARADGGAGRPVRSPPPAAGRGARLRRSRRAGRRGPRRASGTRPAPADTSISVYTGPLIFLAAAAAFGEDHRRRLAWILSAFGILGALLAMHGPPGEWLRSLPPFDRVRYPAKWLAWTVFALAMLSGFGVDRLRFVASTLRRRVAAAVLLLLGAVCARSRRSLRRFASPRRRAARRWRCRPSSRPGARRWARPSRRRPRRVSSPRWRWRRRRCRALPRRRRCAGARRSSRRSPQVSGRVVTPPMGALWSWVLRDDRFDEAMLLRQREALLGYTNLTCRVPALRTAAPLKTAGAAAIEEAVGPAEDALPASAASARMFWTPFPPERLPSRKMEEFYRAPLAPYRPRLSFLTNYRIEPDAERAWQRVASGEIDLTKEVFLDRRPEPDPRGDRARPLLVARLAEDAPERVVAELTTSNPGLLVVTDLHYPGWIAEEDGKRLPLLKADGYFRAVALPAGTHRVVFRYRPLSFTIGAAASVFALLTLLVLWHSGEPVRRRAR